MFLLQTLQMKFKVLRSGVMKLTGGNDDVTVHNNKHKAWDVLNVTLEKVSGAQLNHFPVVSDVIMDSDAELIQTELR